MGYATRREEGMQGRAALISPCTLVRKMRVGAHAVGTCVWVTQRVLVILHFWYGLEKRRPITLGARKAEERGKVARG